MGRCNNIILSLPSLSLKKGMMIGKVLKHFWAMSIASPYLLNEVNIKMGHSPRLVAEPITSKAHAQLVRTI